MNDLNKYKSRELEGTSEFTLHPCFESEPAFEVNWRACRFVYTKHGPRPNGMHVEQVHGTEVQVRHDSRPMRQILDAGTDAMSFRVLY
jgi:hypothetical protein